MNKIDLLQIKRKTPDVSGLIFLKIHPKPGIRNLKFSTSGIDSIQYSHFFVFFSLDKSKNATAKRVLHLLNMHLFSPNTPAKIFN